MKHWGLNDNVFEHDSIGKILHRMIRRIVNRITRAIINMLVFF